MKALKTLVFGILMLSAFILNAQKASTFEPLVIEVTTNKTSSIIFPQPILSIDRGSKDVLAQKASGVENILQVKAATDSFPETNLTVVTADGKLNSFTIRFNRAPSILTISLTKGSSAEKIVLAADKVNSAEVSDNCKNALRVKGKLAGIGSYKNGIKFQLNGLFVKDDLMYCRIFLKNTSNIKYDIDQLRFYIRDSKISKRTSSQEVEVTPVFVENRQYSIDSKNQQTMVVVIPKFTITDKKHFSIEMMEQNGGRNFTLKLTGQRLLQAKIL